MIDNQNVMKFDQLRVIMSEHAMAMALCQQVEMLMTEHSSRGVSNYSWLSSRRHKVTLPPHTILAIQHFASKLSGEDCWRAVEIVMSQPEDSQLDMCDLLIKVLGNLANERATTLAVQMNTSNRRQAWLRSKWFPTCWSLHRQQTS